MQREIERRAAGVRRVAVERIVDVCATSAAPSSAFQGRSVDVSGRGMSVRAAHPPQLEAPVVVRFQEHGSEVIAEGVVAWRRETAQGSEFGVRFTALDSRSVQALKALCQAASLPTIVAPRGEQEEGDTEPVPNASGSVKLHIVGLGAPLSARVRQQGDRRLSLGSSLEFLRVGRSVEVEDGSPTRRGARIDEVDVAIDPESQVPELIVSLCYESGTPLPQTTSSRPPLVSSSRVHSADLFEVDEQRPVASERAISAALTGAAPKRAEAKGDEGREAPARAHANDLSAANDADAVNDSDEAENEDDLELGEAVSSERPPPIIRKAGGDTVRSHGVRSESVDAAGVVRAEAPEDADEPEPPSLEEMDAPSELERLRQRLDGVLDGLSAAARVTGARCRRFGDAASRSATWMASQARGASQNLLAARRVATPTRRTTAAPRPSLRSAIARASARAPGGRADGSTGQRSLPRGTWLAAGFVALAAVGAWRGRPAPSPPPAAAAQPASVAPAPSAPSLPEESPRPRPLLPAVESEPEELGEPETALAQGPLSSMAEPMAAPPELAPRPAPRAPLEKRALARFAPAQATFEEAPVARRKASAPVEFSSGRLELPIVHRLRLDKVGESLRGERTPTGFDVIIPGRKTLESPTSIARRDVRIAKATARNGSDGARLSFRFRSTIPGYKVRLRKDYLEIFISSK